MTGVPAAALRKLLEGLDRLEIPYMVGGSLASGVHGWARTTGDVDMVIRLGADESEDLVNVLRPDFYVDLDQIRAALNYQRSFNVIHMESAFKFDLFPLWKDRYEQMKFSRRRFEEVDLFSDEPLELSVASPEDVILSKLLWYRRGGETSENQWNDVLGVIAVNRDSLDLEYLREWARYLKIQDLLERILAERHEPLR